MEAKTKNGADEDVIGSTFSNQTDPSLNGNKYDEGDALGTTAPTYGEIVAKMTIGKDALYYQMGHQERGIALIFNHEIFSISNLKPRAGTVEDAKNLEKCFNKLGFTVQVFKDLKCSQIKDHLRQTSERDHNNYDCLVVVVLSHGEQGIIYAKDDFYKPEMLWSSFTPDKCLSLAGKPKMFFLQACQGDKLDPGVTMRYSETDGDVETSYRIPQQADFLIVYSTVKGYYSWRNTTKGSWFIQVLTKVLEEHGRTMDLLTLLTHVNRMVAFDFESNVPDVPVMHKQKQIPCIMSMLTRLVKFTDK